MPSGPSPTPRNFRPEPFPYHHEVTLDITTLTNLGKGLGRVEDWVVMVPFSLPGERVRARIFRNHKNYSEADLIEVLRSSPDRVEPVCPLFGECGGCQYQHLDLKAQLEWKRRQVAEVFLKIGGVEVDPEPTLASPRAYGYRAKLTPHYGHWKQGQFNPIGFLKVDRRNEIVDVPECPIGTEEVNRALGRVREEVRHRFRKSPPKRAGTLLLRETPEGVVTDPRAEASAEVSGLKFRFPAGEFFQNNPFILPHFVDDILQRAAAPGVRYLVDAYCGSGLFALCGSRRFERCLGVEVSELSVQWARRNAEGNGIGNCVFEVGEASSIFEAVDFDPKATAVLLDPPRRGSDERFLEQLVDFAPARVVYVSCDPATQARDIRLLLSRGFRLESLRPFDLFPQTRHIETVAVLRPGK